MNLAFFGSDGDFFELAFLNSNTGDFSPTILSSQSNRIVISNPSTGYQSTANGTGFDLSTTPASGTMTSIEVRDSGQRLVANLTGISWGLQAFSDAIDDYFDGNAAPLGALLSQSPLTIDAGLSIFGANFDLPDVSSNITFIGSPLEDRFGGGSGDDRFTPGQSDDGEQLRGSPGNDVYNFNAIQDSTWVDISYSRLGSGITLNLNEAANTATVNKGPNGTDTILNPRGIMLADGLNMSATRNADTFNITTSPAGGFLSISPLDGNDTINATLQNGTLRLDYMWYEPTSGIVANLASGVVSNDGFGNQDQLNLTLDGGRLEIRASNLSDNIVGSSADERFILGAGNDVLNAAGGWDTLRFDRSRLEGGVVVDLLAGTATGVWDGMSFNHTISGIEEVRGSDNGDDTIRGSAANEYFEGNDGNDLLDGRGGDDELRGYDGNDTLIGGDGRDRLRGGNGNDRLDGSGGSAETQGYGDEFVPGLGSDTVMGHADLFASGEGADIAYWDIYGVGGLTFQIGQNGTGTVASGTSGLVNDSFTYIHWFTGSQDADVFHGSAGDEGFQGRRGADVIHGNGGYDQIGYDGDHWDGASHGIVADVAAGTVIDGFGFTDRFTGIERIRGSIFDDVMSAEGAGQSILFRGDDGNDWLAGSAHNDVLRGENDDDILLGDGFEASYAPEEAGAVYRLYLATLAREADATGYNNWTEALAMESRTLLEVANGFVASAEFQATYGALDNPAFVTLLYNNVLDRDPDAQGLDNWVTKLDAGMSRAQVVLGFSQSSEFIAETSSAANAFETSHSQAAWGDDVYRLYVTTLDREPDVTGYINWTGRLAAGAELTSVIDGYVRSPEFQATYGDLDNSAFVTLLYNNVLDRDPDANGLDTWVNRLEEGWTRAEVVRGFSQSTEFVEKTAAPFADWNRGIDHGTGWAEHDWIVGGSGFNIMAGGLFSDGFSFNQEDDGSHVVLDLEPFDYIHFDNFGYGDWSDATAHMTQDGADVVFADQGAAVRFLDAQLSDITAEMIWT
ncbi:DUF4214 domain-containing protein [Salipiger bermudensis]|uniref:DUF4214 domain-containing protein n=1 Tax=Salipiger bermudensis TaxID=344736 RepID=UPI003009F319